MSKKQIRILRRDIVDLVQELIEKKENDCLYRPDELITVWRLITKERLLSRLEQTPPTIALMALAEEFEISPERLLDLANIGEWIQIDRDVRKWNDQDEYDEYWSCHYDEGQSVESYDQLRASLREIKQLEELWTN